MPGQRLQMDSKAHTVHGCCDLRRLGRHYLLLYLLVSLGGVLEIMASKSFAQPVSILVAVDAPPGGNPPGQGEVLRFQYTGTGPVTPLSSIPTSLLQGPNTVAFSPQGELFVSSQREGSIARFIFDATGSFIPNGMITGNQLSEVTGMAFSPWGELFVIAKAVGGPISRFLFDSQGNAIANGTISIEPLVSIGLAFSPSGELFFNQGSTIQRVVFNSQGMAIPNGAFSIGGIPQYFDFNAQGELFLPIGNPIGDGFVRRFLFDSAGNPVPNGTISVSGSPIGVAFSASGELFVSEHFTGGLTRFLFDAAGNAISNGFISTPQLADIAFFHGQLDPIPPQVARIIPNTGGDIGRVSVGIYGKGFAKDATVKLVRPGQPDILGTSVQVRGVGDTITTTFDLAGKARGPWTVAVTNPDGTSLTLPDGFTIEEGRPAQVWVDVIGPSRVRVGREAKFYISYGNHGNVDWEGLAFLAIFVPDGTSAVTVKYRNVTIGQFTPHSAVGLFSLPSAQLAGQEIPYTFSFSAPGVSVGHVELQIFHVPPITDMMGAAVRDLVELKFIELGIGLPEVDELFRQALKEALSKTLKEVIRELTTSTVLTG